MDSVLVSAIFPSVVKIHTIDLTLLGHNEIMAKRVGRFVRNIIKEYETCDIGRER